MLRNTQISSIALSLAAITAGCCELIVDWLNTLQPNELEKLVEIVV